MVRVRSIIITVALGVVLATLGVVAANLVSQGRSSADELSLTSEVQVLASGDIRLWHDLGKTKGVTSLKFEGVALQPPLSPRVFPQRVFMENRSTGDLHIIEPCREVESPPGTKIGFMVADVQDLEGNNLGDTCQRPGVKLVRDQMLKLNMFINLEPGLTSGDYSFQSVFGAFGVSGDLPIPPPGGMVGWWPGDGNANDIIGANHGTLSGEATYAPGIVGEAFSFDGSGDLVQVPDSPELNITGDVTVDLWAKKTVFDDHVAVMVGKGAREIGTVQTADAPEAYFLFVGRPGSGGNVGAGFQRADGSFALVTGPPLSDSEFHHYAYVRGGKTHKLFVDGDVVASGDFTGVPGDTSGLPLSIGALRNEPSPDGFIRYFGGVIDEVGIFNRALTEDEIRLIYLAGSAGKKKP